MERLLNDLIGHMRTVKVAGIDMIHAGRNRLSQNGDRAINIARRSPHLRAGQLHRAIAHAIQIIEVPGSVKLPPRSICFVILFSSSSLLVPNHSADND